MTTPIEIDAEMFERLESIIKTPQKINEMDDAKIKSTIDFCLDRLRRLRMGGRSSSLIALSILLWSAHDRKSDISFNVEDCLALAFRVTMDLSFVQPEWGIVWAGVLISRYLDRLPVESRDEVASQCRLLLRHIEGRADANPTVRHVASTLMQSWDADFPDGLDPVIKACSYGWPDTTDTADITDHRLKQLMDEMSRILPADMTDRERALYRLYMERHGKWHILQTISLK